GLLFSGDTLFAAGWGRTDLPGGSDEQLVESLIRLSTFEDSVRGLPGTPSASETRPAPVGLWAWAPSIASARPSSRRRRRALTIRALASPRRRHGRRTETCSSQPRVGPSGAVSSAK